MTRTQHRGYNLLSAVFAISIALTGAWFLKHPSGLGETGLRFIPVPSQPIELDAAPRLGPGHAPLVLMVFSDFQCPYCRAFARGTFPALIDRYVTTEKAQLVFRHLPVERSHTYAVHASMLAECSRSLSDNRFWRVHDRLFEPASLDLDDIFSVAGDTGFSPLAFEECLQSTAARHRIDEDLEAARKLNVRSTPTTFIGARRQDGTVNVLSAFVGAAKVAPVSRELDRLLVEVSRGG